MSDRYPVGKFLEAIERSGGIVSAIASRVGCSWITAKKFIDSHPTALAAWQAERERINDKAESNIVVAIDNGDLSMSQWWLKVMRNEIFGDRTRQAVDVTSKGEKLPSSSTIIVREYVNVSDDQTSD